MKKFTVKASALAIMAALPGFASAGAITLGTADVDINTLASELNYNSAAGGTAVATGDTVETTLGFGVSAGQNRYARVVLSSNANFAAAVAGASFRDQIGVNSGFGADASATDGVTIVSGGGIGASCVVYQVTGLAVTGNLATATVQWTPPSLNITSTSSVTATYSLHETATSASCSGGQNNALLATPVTGNIVNLANSLVFTGTDGSTATADVTTLYLNEIDITGGPADVTQLQLGTLTADILANPEADASDVDQADLITAASIKVSGDFTALTTGNVPVGSVTLSTSGDCNTPAAIAATTVVAADKQSVTFSGAAVLALWADAAAANSVDVCYNVNNSTPIQASTYTAQVTFTAAVGATLGAQATQPSGVVVRDGTVLKAPVMAGAAGQSTYVQLSNMGSLAAPYTTRCFAPSGAVSVGAPGTVAAGNTLRLFYNNLACGAGANSVEFTFAVPKGTVVGSLVRQSTTTGDSALDSLTGNQ